MARTDFRALWPHYFEQSDGICFVVDSSDRDRFETVKSELHRLISHKELVGKPFLILANKQDLPNAASKEELTKISRVKCSTKFRMAYCRMLCHAK